MEKPMSDPYTSNQPSSTLSVQEIDADKCQQPFEPEFWYIHGDAYDLHDWLPSHPGGRYLLDITRGTDCTELFEMYHAASLKTTSIRGTLRHYRVPAAPTSDKPRLALPTTYERGATPLYDDLQRVVRAYRRWFRHPTTTNRLKL